MEMASIVTHPFGQTGVPVTRVGLGGEGVLRTHKKNDEARAVIRTAISRGITYFDSARVYADSEVYLGGVWQESPVTRNIIFQASKSPGRDKQGAEKDLDETLARLGVDHIDLWQIHDVRTAEEFEQIAGPGGALEAFTAARNAGKTRFIGVTGHHDPEILTRAVEEWPVDAVMMPVNPAEGVLGGFLTQTLPAARQKGIATIGMKILGGGQYVVPRLGVSPELLIRYALDRDISVAIVGCSTPDEVKTLAALGRGHTPLTDDEHDELLEKFTPHARELAFYRGAV